MEFYYTSSENISRDSLTITGVESYHLVSVLRKKKNDVIFVTNGNGDLFRCEISEADNKNIRCKILSKEIPAAEPDIKIHLFPAVLKNNSRFEFIIEKAVELGVLDIFPIITSRTLSVRSGKTERWRSIALAAMKQSQRCFLPRVSMPLGFSDAIESCSGIKIITHEILKKNSVKPGSLRKTLNKGDEVSIFIGPEGGFTHEEVEYAINMFAVPFHLGVRKLRSETAAIYTISNLLN